ncbi:excalibur calcium-binding domain-containing protein [Micromonospora sp. NPDC048868]|uniref:excalibur calcium-binding domain-containing protein n=1 Tax=Micromonospora sp. NPDC048868 TaxID=3364258 RepID=UPI0037215020
MSRRQQAATATTAGKGMTGAIAREHGRGRIPQCPGPLGWWTERMPSLPMRRGRGTHSPRDPGYSRKLDRDGDGIACE